MKKPAYSPLTLEIQDLTDVGRVVVPLVPGPDAAYAPCVEVGQEVSRGQVIAKSEAPGTAWVHSPMSGRVVQIFSGLSLRGENARNVVIEGDAGVPPRTMAPMAEEVAHLNGERVCSRLKEAGITALGGNGAHAHYATLCGEFEAPETLAVLCSDADTHVQTQRQILRASPEKVIEGATILQKAIGAERLVFSVFNDQLDLVSGETLKMARQYPAAHPEMVMAAVTGSFRLQEPRPRPDIFAVNAETALAARDAVREGLPVISKVLTVGGHGGGPALVRVPLGTPFSRILAFTERTAEEGDRLVTGGLLMGQAQYDLDAPVTKGTDALFLQKGKEIFLYEDQACLGCGRCVKACPMKIPVNMMTRNCEYGKIEEAVSYNLGSCIECGLCAYVCSAKRPLVQYILFAKAEMQKLERQSE